LLDKALRSVSKLCRKFSKFPDGDLYMFTIPIVQHGKYNSTTQTAKSFIADIVHMFLRKMKILEYTYPTIVVEFPTKISTSL
jgi:hypothetical protein